MATLTVQQVLQAGIVPSYVDAAAGGDKFQPGANVWLHVKNGSGGVITVTVDSKVPSNYGDDVNLVNSVAAGAEEIMGPFPPSRFASPTDGLADISYSGVTSLTVGVFRI